MQKIIHIEGMSCQHCVGRVKKYLDSVPHVSGVHVDLEGKQAVFQVDGPIDMDAVVKAIGEFGFTAGAQD
jgi:copper chaperone CopZ